MNRYPGYGNEYLTDLGILQNLITNALNIELFVSKWNTVNQKEWDKGWKYRPQTEKDVVDNMFVTENLLQTNNLKERDSSMHWNWKENRENKTSI